VTVSEWASAFAIATRPSIIHQVHPAGPVGREVARQQRHGHDERSSCGQGGRIVGFDFEQRVAQKPRHGQRQDEADRGSRPSAQAAIVSMKPPITPAVRGRNLPHTETGMGRIG
jgi:hypothetical protein